MRGQMHISLFDRPFAISSPAHKADLMKLPFPPMTVETIPRPVAYSIRQGVTPTRAFRQYAGISLERLASEAGLPVRRIKAIENGVGLTDFEVTRLEETLAVPASILRTRS